MNNPGLSCVFVQGLLLLGYAYRVPALWAIPDAPLQAEDHLRVAHAVAEAELIEIVLDVFSTDRHSFNPLMIFPRQRSHIVLSRGSSSSYHIRNFTITFCSSVSVIQSTHTGDSCNMDISQTETKYNSTIVCNSFNQPPGFFLSFSDHLIPALPFHQHQL